MFHYLERILLFIGFKIIVERDFHKVGVEKDQIILFSEICDITGSGAPILFIRVRSIKIGRRMLTISSPRTGMANRAARNKNIESFFR